MLSKPNHGVGQQIKGPSLVSFGWIRAGGGNQQCRLLTRQLARRPWAGFLTERQIQVALHKPPLGPVDRRSADREGAGDHVVAGTSVGGQEDLCSLDLARHVFATAEQRCKFGALPLAEFDRSRAVEDDDESSR